jgi:hypothetical protein
MEKVQVVIIIQMVFHTLSHQRKKDMQVLSEI